MNNPRRSVEAWRLKFWDRFCHGLSDGYKVLNDDPQQTMRQDIEDFIYTTLTAERAYYEGEMKEFETLKELYKERCDNANLAWKKAEEWKGLSEKLFAKIGELEETITRLEAKAKKEMGE